MSITDAAAPLFCAGLKWRLQHAETVMYVHTHNRVTADWHAQQGGLGGEAVVYFS